MITAAQALGGVPRDAFIPEVIFAPAPDTGWLVPVRRGEEPERWRRAVQADAPVVTAVAFDPRVPLELRDAGTGRGVVATSSSSAPHVVARMLDALELEPGMRVLEIGTGTGHTAAVLAHMLGDRQVTTVELDPAVAERARTALHRAGYLIDMVVGDGTQGYAPRAPYDRILATAAVERIPRAWLEQTRAGGCILTPWTASFHPDGPLALLAVEPGGAARGRFLGPGGFMPLRGAEHSPPRRHDAGQTWQRAGRPDCTRYGLTITHEGEHRIWLDTPEHQVSG